MTGMILMYSGGAIGYKSKFQTVIAHSSTEAEFVAACDTAKMILFFRSLLQDIALEQTQATILFEDNHGALMMADAQQPTKRTRHIDIKHFALLDWVEQDLLILEAISTHDNAADAMIKTLTKQLFYRHYDTYMGIRIPDYCALSTHQTSHPSSSLHTDTTKIQPARSMGGGGTRHTYVDSITIGNHSLSSLVARSIGSTAIPRSPYSNFFVSVLIRSEYDIQI